MIDVISQSYALDSIHDKLILTALTEGFLDIHNIAHHAAHYEVRMYPSLLKKETTSKKRTSQKRSTPSYGEI